MDVTIEVADEKMREAESALNIHDPAQLFLTLLDERLARAEGNGAPPRSGQFNFSRTLAAAAALPDLSDEQFAAFEREMNRPLPPAQTECV